MDLSLSVTAYNIKGLKQVVHVFELFSLKSCVNPVDHIVVRLLLLLLYLGEFLEMFLPVSKTS